MTTTIADVRNRAHSLKLRLLAGANVTVDEVLALANAALDLPGHALQAPTTSDAVIELHVDQLHAIAEHCQMQGIVVLAIPALADDPLIVIPRDPSFAGAASLGREDTALVPVAGRARDRARDAIAEQGYTLEDFDLEFVPTAYIVFEGYALYVEHGDLMYAPIDTKDDGAVEFQVARCVDEDRMGEVPVRIVECLGPLRQAAWALVPRLDSTRRPVAA